MAVRLIAGRAGAGKTHWCQSQICEALASSLVDGPRLVMLVPEQAALQMERGLLAMSPVRALGRCEVLSFRRLARRILQTSRAGMPVVMTPLGRQMALRHLVGRRRKSLQEFRGVADRTGFLDGLSQTLVELMREAVAVDRIEQAAVAAAAASDPSGPRLHDIAIVYRAYLDYLGSERVDPEGVLDLARAGLSRTAWLAGAEIWMDGFAGLSQQQVRMVAALAQRVGRVNVSMLVDPSSAVLRDSDREADDLSLFARAERTWVALARTVRTAGITIEEPILLGSGRCPRYGAGSPLAALERRLFSVPCGPEPSDGDQAESDSSKPPLPSTEVRFLRAADRRAEVDATVRTLVDLVQSATAPMRYRDIAVVVRDLSLYHDLLSAALRAHGVPFFIDRRRPTHHHPLIELVRAVLAMRGDEGFGPAVAMLLKTDLSGLDDVSADALENYQLAYGLMSASSWEEVWDHPPPGFRGRADSAGVEAAALQAVVRSRDALRERIGAWWPDAGSGKGRPSCRTWAERLYALLERFEVAARLDSWRGQAAKRGDLDEAAEHEQVWSDLMKLLDELAATLGDERMSGREFQAVVESALAELTLGLVPPTLDQVLVSSIERSRHPAVRAAFVLGFSDGQFPLRLTEDVVIRDEERAWLARSEVALGRTRSQRVLDERMLAYIALTRPSEFLWVSYPEGDETGRALSPSPYWGALRAALPDVPVETIDATGPESVSTTSGLAGRLGLHLRTWCEGTPDGEDAARWLALYRWAVGEAEVRGTVGRSLAALAPAGSAALSAEAIAALWPPPHRTSVTGLEQFARCPFQHFVSRGLGLEPRAEHEVSTLDMGRLYHTILEQFVHELIESGRSLSELSTRDIARNLKRLSELAIPQLADEMRMAERDRRGARRRSARELPPAVVGEQLSVGKTKLQPFLTEQSFGVHSDDALPALELHTSGGRVVSVRGKIDRVDLLAVDGASLAVVFDYKRSIGRRLRLDEVYHGLALQLLAYLLVVADCGERLGRGRLVPGGAFYMPLLGDYARLPHPDDADEVTGYRCFRPRGIVDFDWIHELEPKGDEAGHGEVFNVFRKKDGTIGRFESSDVVPAGQLPAVLEHTRRSMTELADRWISGDISVKPSRLGDEMPCKYCRYRAVCRMEYASCESRRLAEMSRTEVLDRIATEGRAVDG